MQTKLGIKKENTNSKRWNNTTVPRISSKILASLRSSCNRGKESRTIRRNAVLENYEREMYRTKQYDILIRNY